MFYNGSTSTGYWNATVCRVRAKNCHKTWPTTSREQCRDLRRTGNSNKMNKRGAKNKMKKKEKKSRSRSRTTTSRPNRVSLLERSLGNLIAHSGGRVRRVCVCARCCQEGSTKAKHQQKNENNNKMGKNGIWNRRQRNQQAFEGLSVALSTTSTRCNWVYPYKYLYIAHLYIYLHLFISTL